MSKSILIIDTPKKCIDCPCSNCNEHDTYCGMNDMHLEYDFEHGYIKPDWCPLKPIPQEIKYSIYDFDTDEGYAIGWNDCIKYLIKE